MIRKIKISYLALCIIFFIKSNSIQAMTEDFRFIINTIGIPEYNLQGEAINEDIYEAYQVFCYSSPQNMIGKVSSQRFKQVENEGKWTEFNGKYKGEGTRGEYYILGTNYAGEPVDNMFFPLDFMPETVPQNWKYISIVDAILSWENTNLYRYPEQLEYMKNSKLCFDKLDFNNQTSNSYEQIEYPITSSSIGLNLVKLNVVATWKTNGIVTARRQALNGQVRDAIFSVKPMAAQADISSYLCMDESVEMPEENEKVDVNITFGANVIHLNDYAKPSHIKQICSIIYINGKEISKVIDSKIDTVEKSIVYSFTKDMLEEDTKVLKVKVLSYLYTEFKVDGLIKNVVEKDLVINMVPRKIVPVSSMNQFQLRTLVKKKEKLLVRPFIQTAITEKSGTFGIVEKGRICILKISLNTHISNISDITFFINGQPIILDLNFQGDDDKQHTTLEYKFEVGEDMINSIASWKSLREEKRNYYDICFDEVGTRIGQPNILTCCMRCQNEEYEYLLLIDSMDYYIQNRNFFFVSEINNKKELIELQTLEEFRNAI